MVMTINNLSLSRSGKQVLDNISGEIERGKIIALLGPNGAGKSTLIQCMAGLLQFDGEIALKGKNLKHYNAELLAQNLAYLPQHSQLQFPLTVEEVLSLATLPFPLTRLEQRQQIAALIKEWGIEKLAEKDFRQLSGGEQQRCQIARTYLQLDNILQLENMLQLKNKSSSDAGCGIWLLDEPSSSLDLEHQQQLQSVCLQAAKKGHCVVIVLHDLNQAMRLADEVWLLDKGQLVAQGLAKEIMTEELIGRVFNVAARKIKDKDESFFIFN